MALESADIRSLAELVDNAALNGAAITMLTAAHPAMTLEDAYVIQRASIGHRAERGDALVGMKMGLTSRAKMEQMGVHNPIYGHLTRTMRLDDGGTMTMAGHCHPRVEPELAFIMGEDLEGPVSPAEAMAAVKGVCAALEVIDSRYENFKFTLIDVVADNASSSHFVLGNTLIAPADIDISNLGMVMEIDGQVVESGSSAAIYDHPARSLAALAGMLADVGESLKAGQVVLAGGATKAVHLKAGNHVRLLVDGLGTAEFRVA